MAECIISNYTQADHIRVDNKYVVEILFHKLHPVIKALALKFQNETKEETHILRLLDTYNLCCSQTKRGVMNFLDIFKIEHQHQFYLQESRQCVLERLLWCLSRLTTINETLDKCSLDDALATDETLIGSFISTPMYFVNWIDHTFELLARLADTVSKLDYRDDKYRQCDWKNEIAECLTELHISLDELLLSAMTLCRYCLPSDQPIIKARCQVVLREGKLLFNELIEENSDTSFEATSESLKLPVNPSNINVLIDVLKDVLYVLETNTNTALLTLLVHSFVNNKSPVDALKDHFKQNDCSFPGHVKNDNECDEDCPFVKEFDLYNERLLQIGLFAVSCSSDKNRVLSLRSGLASLEAIDPYLVPALMVSADSLHAQLLIKFWHQEVQEIRNVVFLIVDPGAFVDKSKQMMHQTLLKLIKEGCYLNNEVCIVINIGCVLQDFFDVYSKREPEALTHQDKLLPLLADLNKVLMECKVVSNYLTSGDDFTYDLKKNTSKKVTFEQVLKRLKLLYTLVKRIDSLYHPKETVDQFFDSEIDENPMENDATYTMDVNNGGTYVNSPRKREKNVSRSIFARASNKKPKSSFPLSKLTKHLQVNKCQELSFSAQLDELFNMSDNNNINVTKIVNKNLMVTREQSVLYNFSPRKNRSSLRKAVLDRHCRINLDKEFEKEPTEKETFLNEAESLQISEILDQMNDMTNDLTQILSITKPSISYENQNHTSEANGIQKINNNILRLNLNSQNTTISKYIWNIPVNSSIIDMPSDESGGGCNVTQPSNVDTLERINDLDLLEKKLNSLRSLDLETSL